MLNRMIVRTKVPKSHWPSCVFRELLFPSPPGTDITPAVRNHAPFLLHDIASPFIKIKFGSYQLREDNL